MPAEACDRCGKKDFTVDPTASGLCSLCQFARQAERLEAARIEAEKNADKETE